VIHVAERIEVYKYIAIYSRLKMQKRKKKYIHWANKLTNKRFKG